MSEQEVFDNIKFLRNKIIHTKSKKIKRMCMIDMMYLREFLSSCYDRKIDDSVIYYPGIFEDSMDEVEKMNEQEIQSYIDLNDTTKKLANGCINIFTKFDYKQQEFDRNRLSTEKLNELTFDFINTMDDSVFEKYKELADKVLVYDLVEYGGVCWNFKSLKKQVINLSSFYYNYNENMSDIDFFKVFVHELGHAVHLSKIENIGSKTLFGQTFEEANSILYEKMFLDFLEKNNINIKENLREEYNLLLDHSIGARGGALAVENNDINKDGIIPNKYFSSEFFDKYYEISRFFYNEPYTITLPYFYGELIATKVIDNNVNDYKNASKEMLDLLIRAENENHNDLLKEKGLDQVPKGVARTLRKIQE